MTSGHTFSNRLANESSSYLRQHAHNPVDWFPWGDEAFEQAKAKNLPVFLSIGYSTCHWCHVMEHESFANEEIAAYLNEHFISIKLDREERPDLDDIYMTGLQLMGGQGGWPMSNFITVEGKPFYAGTYYPPADFLALLKQISSVWHERKIELLEHADEMAKNISTFSAAKENAADLDQNLMWVAAEQLLKNFDVENGGFGRSPKFPMEPQLLMLLDCLSQHARPDLQDALELTLHKMAEGGIYDQVGGGFHRYSVDAEWQVPHFEKMLYNQAQLVRVYISAFELTGDPAFLRVVTQTIKYVQRDMTGVDGRFFSATDADSDGGEGRYFLWRVEEIRDVLEAQDAVFAEAIYQTSASGNFEGSNILHLNGSLESFADQQNLTMEELTARLGAIQQKLYLARQNRPLPHRDEKHIVAWNAMMVTSLLQAKDHVADAAPLAIRCLDAIWDHHIDEHGTLWRVGFEDHVSTEGSLEDYAYLAEAMLTLFYVENTLLHQTRARQLIEQMIARFWDEEGKGFFTSSTAAEGPLIARTKSVRDTGIASGNAVALQAMTMAIECTGDIALNARVNEMINGFAGHLAAAPSAAPYMLMAVNRYRDGARGSIQYAAEGHMRVELKQQPAGCQLHISLQPGWHINGKNSGTGEPLIQTKVTGCDTYQLPEADVLEADFDIVLGNPGSEVSLIFQACSDALCLQPEQLTFKLPQLALVTL